MDAIVPVHQNIFVCVLSDLFVISIFKSFVLSKHNNPQIFSLKSYTV